jgi:hypothetical protein
MGVLDKATTVAEDPGPWSAVIYGPPGSGKTVFACQSQGPLLLDYEKGRRSLLNHDELVSTPILKIRSLDQARQTALDLTKDLDERIKTVIVDTISTAQTKDMTKQLSQLEGDRKEQPSQFEWTKNNRRISNLCEEFLRMGEATNRNVVFLCHIKEEKDEDSNVVLIRPGVNPGLVPVISALVDGVFYLTRVGDSKGLYKQTLNVISTKKTIAKDRFGLPPTIESPHFSMIEEAAEKQRQKALQLIQTSQTQKEN